MKNLKQFLYPFFTLGKGEQKGIVILFLLVFGIWSAQILLPYLFTGNDTEFADYKNDILNFRLSHKAYTDSMNLRGKQLKGSLDYDESLQLLKPFDFDPNKLDKLSFMEMGFSEKQFKVIKNYLEKGGRFYKKEDFKKIYGISNAEYQIVEPYIIIDTEGFMKKKQTAIIKKDRKVKKASSRIKSAKAKKNPVYMITELNSADTIKLVNNLHIKAKLAKRIIKYRELLGGFYEKEQLLEVYGFPTAYYKRIQPFLLVDSLLIRKIYINEVGFKALLKHPYFNYETTKLIFNAKSRSPLNQFSNYEGLKQRTAINDSLGSRIKHYLYFGRTK
ncbi:MAG: helix-hairpin-helix domain-containing protein [Chlorobi bacterium]|nr:helix-hairpin-helix domain-containing protein [Chlorobiota bacterium]